MKNMFDLADNIKNAAGGTGRQKVSFKFLILPAYGMLIIIWGNKKIHLSFITL